jgi:hypothetical protein
MVSPAVKVPVPLLLNLYTNRREDEDEPTVDSWVVGPVLKMVTAFVESTSTLGAACPCRSRRR